jgi:hypothetical protein
MDPLEFCSIYIESLRPGDRGYRAACIKLLSAVTGVKPRTIGDWGARFEQMQPYAKRILGLYHLGRELECLARSAIASSECVAREMQELCARERESMELRQAEERLRTELLQAQVENLQAKLAEICKNTDKYSDG